MLINLLNIVPMPKFGHWNINFIYFDYEKRVYSISNHGDIVVNVTIRQRCTEHHTAIH